MLAADNVVRCFREIGLAPAGERGGYFQAAAFEEQTKGEAIRLDDYVAALAVEIANGAARPAWNAGSVFRPAADGRVRR